MYGGGSKVRGITDNKVVKLLQGFAACKKETGPTADYVKYVTPNGEARHSLRRTAAQCTVDADLRLSEPDLTTCHGAVWSMVTGLDYACPRVCAAECNGFTDCDALGIRRCGRGEEERTETTCGPNVDNNQCGKFIVNLAGENTTTTDHRESAREH